MEADGCIVNKKADGPAGSGQLFLQLSGIGGISCISKRTEDRLPRITGEDLFLQFLQRIFPGVSGDADQRIGVTLCTLMLIAGIYMFFNNSTLKLSQTLLIGICMIILGLRRFWQSFSIEYSRPSFVTGNEEKLMEAQEDEKRALAKAKEGIREQKNAQRRIAKIKADMAAEQDIMISAAITRQEREAERELEE